jgi:hypothetical protein
MTKIKCCPKCGKSGFLSKRWVQSYYYPKYTSTDIITLQEHKKQLQTKIPRNDYDKFLIENSKNVIKKLERNIKGSLTGKDAEEMGIPNSDKSKRLAVKSEKYFYTYVGHDGAELYRQQKLDYQSGRRKSKPTGRRWCNFVLFYDSRKEKMALGRLRAKQEIKKSQRIQTVEDTSINEIVSRHSIKRH